MSTAAVELEMQVLLAELETIKLDPSKTELQRGLDDLKNLAKTILGDCSGPIRLGILGEFSAGKTRLIEAMLGLFGRLPTGEIPSTGNISEFHCKVVPGLNRSEFGGFHLETGAFSSDAGLGQIVFVSHLEAREFLEFLRSEADTIFKAQDGEFRERLDAVPAGDWDRWRQWAEYVFENARKYDLRFLAFEAFRFAQAFQACGAALEGRTIEVSDQAVVETAMKLAGHSAAVGRSSELSLPPCPPRLKELPKTLNAEMMAGLFPLVRVVRLGVRLPEELGRELQGDGENPFVLVDCPGLGAEESTLRDKFLSLRELKSVESILIVVNSRRPGSDGAVVLHDMMEVAWNANIKDRILVAIGRFDEVLGNAARLDAAETIARTKEPLSSDDLLNLLHDPLGKLIRNARKPLEEGRLDRISIVSGNLAIWDLKQKRPALRLGDDGLFQREFTEEAVNVLEKSRNLWKAIAQRLDNGEINDALYADWFREYADDGGLSRLKNICRIHIKEHGSALLDAKIADKQIVLKQKHKVFKEAMAAEPALIAPATPATGTAKPPVDFGQAALRLSSIYQGILGELNTKGVKSLSFRPPGRIDLVGVFEYLREECIVRIGGWEEWHLLFDNVDPMQGPGQIRVVNPRLEEQAGDDDDDDDVLLGIKDLSSKPVPTKTDDFFTPFVRTIREIETIAREINKHAVGLVLEDHEAKVREGLGKDAPAYFEAIRNPDLAAQLEPLVSDSSKQKVFASALRNAVAPSVFLKPLWKENFGLRKTDDDDDWFRSIFPLALTSKDRSRIGRVFHWEPEISRRFGAAIVHGRHQIHVIRNRQALEESAVFHAKRIVEGYRHQVGVSLASYYTRMSANLKTLSVAVDSISRPYGG